MADTARDNLPLTTTPNSVALGRPVSRQQLQYAVGLLLAALLLLVTLSVLLAYTNAAPDSQLVVNSSLGQLGAWMSDQSTQDVPPSLFGQFAKSQAAAMGQPSLDVAVANQAARTIIIALTGVVLVAGLVGLVGLIGRSRWARPLLVLVLIGLDLLLFTIPPLDGDSTVAMLLVALSLSLILLMVAPGKVSKAVSILIVMSILFLAWEALKVLGTATHYQITLPSQNWNSTVYPTLDDSLVALQNNQVNAVIVDSKEVRDFVPPYPEKNVDPNTLPYPNLRILSTSTSDIRGLIGLPTVPSFPGRLAVVVRQSDVTKWNSIADFLNQPVGTFSDSYANQNFLAVPRNLLLVDLRVTNDLNMPHLQSISASLLQPARRSGDFLLVRILGGEALFTLGEALLGFVWGALLGFLLGAVFAHFRMLERGLLPYVIASQTIPILALAPMVVIWLGAGPGAVAVISAYLTFFPVTINTLRGLTSPHPTALELMHSYAASRWTILWKLRFPSALPYIFTALKVSATGSVVGAIIGELSSGVSDGLGRAILDFNQYYTSGPAKLWAAILIAALVGIGAFIGVTLLERWVLGQRVQAN